MDNNVAFEGLYNELEELLCVKYHLDATASGVYVHETRVGGQISKNLKTLRELRNYIVHEKRPDLINAVIVTDEALQYLRKMIDSIRKPTRAIETSIPRDKILFASLSTPIKPLLQSMLDQNVSHVPVLNPDGTIFGVFSGAMMFVSVVSSDSMAIDGTTVMKIFEPWLPIQNHIGERYWFVARNAPIDDIIGLFGKTLKDGKKLKMLFVTENGKPTEKILGLITPWDILDNDVVAIQ